MNNKMAASPRRIHDVDVSQSPQGGKGVSGWVRSPQEVQIPQTRDEEERLMSSS